MITLQELPAFNAKYKVSHLLFLYAPYKPQYFYWEVIESQRRLLLGAMLSVIFSGDPTSQIGFGLFISILSLSLQARLHVYREESDNRLAFLANQVVSLTFFFSLLLYAKQSTGNPYGRAVCVPTRVAPSPSRGMHSSKC